MDVEGPLGRVDNNQFIEFPLSVAIPAADSGQSLAFKTVQTYSNGQVVHWIGPASADTPSPTINVTPAGGVVQDVAGAEAGPAAGQQPVAPGRPPPPTRPPSTAGRAGGWPSPRSSSASSACSAVWPRSCSWPGAGTA